MRRPYSNPPVGARVNWSCPITRGLVFAHVANLGRTNDLVSGAMPTGTMVSEFGPLGVANRTITYSLNPNISFGFRDFSLGFWAKVSGVASAGVTSQALLHSTDFSGASNHGILLNAMASDAGGKWRFQCMNNAYYTIDSTTGWDTYPTVFVLCTMRFVNASGSIMKIYVNGREEGEFNSAGGAQASTMGWEIGRTATSMDILMYQTYMWGRVVTPSEAMSLYLDKYQMLAPASAGPVIFAAPSAGGSAGKAYYYSQTQGLRG